MSPTVLLILASYFIALYIVALTPMQPIYNRPQMFWGARGQKQFFWLQTGLIIFTLSILLWSLITQGFFVALVFGAGTYFIGPIVVTRTSPTFLKNSAFGPLISFIVLAILNYVAWSH